MDKVLSKKRVNKLNDDNTNMGSDFDLLSSIWIRKYFLPLIPLNVKNIQRFDEAPHFKVNCLISNVLIIFGYHPVSLVDLGTIGTLESTCYFLRQAITASTGTDKDTAVDLALNFLLSPIRAHVDWYEKPRTIRYTLIDMDDLNKKGVQQLFVNQTWTNSSLNKLTVTKLAHRLAKILGITTVHYTHLDPLDIAIDQTFPPLTYVMSMFPDPVSRQFIFINLMRIIQAGDETQTVLLDIDTFQK